ncbi:hypothetical protein PPGU19_028820 [Paraburkholderia sp. PGU19]|nr:hypothetical protein PPGU19_028820 [Paraburkholderia sp. PGU19]
MYVAIFVETVHAPRCIQKQTQATSWHDGEITDARDRAVVMETAKFTIDTLVEMMSRIGKPVTLAVG